MTEHTKLNIGETSYQISKKFIDDMENLFVSAKINVDLPEECEEGCEYDMCGSWIHSDCYKAIETMRNNPIYDFHLKRTEMMVRPDNKHLTDKEKLAVKSKKGIHKYMKCYKCLCVITKKEKVAHEKRKKCIKTYKQRTHHAVITIQRWGRYWVHKKKYLKQQKKLAKKQNKKERRSARKIQAIWRGYIVRKNNLIRKDIVNNVVNTAIAYAIEQEEQRAKKPVIVRVIKVRRKKQKKEKEPEPAELTIDEMLKKFEEAYYEVADMTIPTMPQLKKKFGEKAVQEKLVYMKEISITYNNKVLKAIEINKLYSQKIQNEGTEEQKRELANCVRGLNREQTTASGAVKRRLKAIHKL